MKKLLALIIALAGLDSLAFAQQTSAPKAPPDPAVAASRLRGKALYAHYCLSCHQADGGGAAGLKPPRSKTSLLGERSKVIFGMLAHVRGQCLNDGYLTDQQMADVLTYVRNRFGNKASAITAAEVKDMRRVMFLKSMYYKHSSVSDTSLSGW